MSICRVNYSPLSNNGIKIRARPAEDQRAIAARQSSRQSERPAPPRAPRGVRHHRTNLHECADAAIRRGHRHEAAPLEPGLLLLEVEHEQPLRARALEVPRAALGVDRVPVPRPARA